MKRIVNARILSFSLPIARGHSSGGKLEGAFVRVGAPVAEYTLSAKLVSHSSWRARRRAPCDRGC